MLEDLETLRLYKKYLNTIQPVLDKYFKNQEEYICCKKGCSKCCEFGAYPFSKIEFDYIMTGFFKLERTVQMEVIQRINALKEEFSKTEDKAGFMYRCPFLDGEGLCTVYEQRGLICRTFGLIQKNIEDKVTLPFCYKHGLNYSKVYNPDTKTIDGDKVKENGYKTMPQIYKISLGKLTSSEMFQEESFDFGEIKSLIEWLNIIKP